LLGKNPEVTERKKNGKRTEKERDDRGSYQQRKNRKIK
jgi:hypothetical protein